MAELVCLQHRLLPARSLKWNVCQAATTMPLDALPTEILGAVCEEKNWQKLQ
jgi:hypothetical protein